MNTALCDFDLEKNILGACLLNSAAIFEAAERIQSSDFANQFLGRLFGRLIELAAAGKTTDPSSVALSFRGDPEFDSAGGEDFLHGLASEIVTPAPVATWAEILSTLAIRRLLAHEIEEKERAVNGSLRPTEEILESLHGTISMLREGVEGARRSAVYVRDLIKELGPVLETAGRGNGLMIGIPTGFLSLDHITAGHCPGTYCLLAGRPSTGKSALSLVFAMMLAKMGHAVAIFSLEMSRESLLLRLLCCEAKIDMQRLRTGTLSEEGWSRIPKALVRLSELPILIDDRRGVRIADLRWRIRSLARRHKVRLVILDYLQLVKAPGDKRYEQVTNVSMELQAAAGDLGQISDGCLLAVAQLNRLAASEPPMLHHLRDSGQLEQDADSVFLSGIRTKRSELGRPHAAPARHRKTAQWPDRSHPA